MLPQIELPTSPSYKARGCTAAWPCCVCGRDVKKPKHWIHIVNGGGEVCDPDDTSADPAGDCGLHPIGSDCLRRFSQLRPYVVEEI